jgi:hypothetical protein
MMAQSSDATAAKMPIKSADVLIAIFYCPASVDEKMTSAAAVQSLVISHQGVHSNLGDGCISLKLATTLVAVVCSPNYSTRSCCAF